MIIVNERKKVVLQAIKKVLKCETLDVDEQDTPTIAVLASGGGLRAMISLAGTLEALNEAGLLNCVTYLCGVSGSTWCMSSIYDIQDWTKFDEVVQKIKEQITKDKVEWDEIIAQLRGRVNEDTFSLTDIWAIFVAYFMTHQVNIQWLI
ncbi:cytosolic phospholipase A2 beta-like [Protopterus annectens]|uniref:cytosolic phospholipase A2 beta-like n=1 Tax=Protopterus annectens TaxID=7888 RepID=UPI001CFB08D2|nr:cytosolic phospholipase A2 beta-like [Protopterus annectens]